MKYVQCLVESRFKSSVHSIQSARLGSDERSKSYVFSLENGNYITFYEHVTEDNGKYFLYSSIG